MSSLMTSLVLIAALLMAQRLSAEDNPILNELQNRGVRVTKDATAVLPPATLRDGMSATVQRQEIAAIPDNRHSWENLTRRSVVAPFVLKISETEEGPGSIGRRVDVWFVTYGKLERLASEEFLRGQFQDVREIGEGENRPRIQLLGNDMLRQRGLPVPVSPSDLRFLAVEMSLLERVRISGTTRSIKTSTPQSVTIASVLDPRFDQDPEFSNSWRSIERDAAGRRQYGPRHVYNSLGSYVKATRLHEPDGALLIEYHVAFAEPEGWFHGANLLRSKLPIVAQETVRRFRRNFDKPQENAAAARVRR